MFWKFNFTPNHVVWLLVLVAMILGGIIAMQTSDGAGINELRRNITELRNYTRKNEEEISRINLDLSNFKRSSELYQAEQRQNVLDFANALKRIEVEQIKKGLKK